jgi:uncharacterized protein (DUF885 family)
MDDAAFKRAVLERLDRIESDLAEDTRTIRSDLADGFAQAARRMDALSARMDDVENRLDAVASRTDHMLRLTEQLHLTANEALREARNGVDSLYTLGKRVTRLEHPDE